MMRILSLGVFWRCGRMVSRRFTYKRSSSFVLPVRHFSDGVQDAPLPKADTLEENPTIDLDRWKSVMRAHAPLAKSEVGGAELVGDDASQDDPELQKATRLYTLWRAAGRDVPTQITQDQIKSLAGLSSKSAKIKYLRFLAIKENHKLKRMMKQEQKRAEKEAVLRAAGEQGEEERGPQQVTNTLFPKSLDRSMEKALSWRAAQAMQFGQPLIIDMSYESDMTQRDTSNAVSQIMEVEAWNRRSADPFHLYYCNLQSDGPYMKELLTRYTAEAWNRLLVTCTDRQHVDVFPPEKLVYLTADSPNVLHTFDHSKVYIIGALVDRCIKPGLSLANGKRFNLATARLPLDEYLHWMTGGKNLTLDQMIRIMLTVKDTGKWMEALQFVPQRKHCGFFQPRQALKSDTSARLGGQGHHGSRMAAHSSSGYAERSGGRINREGKGLYNSQARSGSAGVGMHRLTSDGGKEAPTARTQTSWKTDMPRRVVKKHNVWWNNE